MKDLKKLDQLRNQDIEVPAKKPLNLAEIVEDNIIESDYSRSEKPFNLFSPSQIGYCKRQMYNRKMNLTVMPRYVQGILHAGTVNHFWLEHNLPSLVEDRQMKTEVRIKQEFQTSDKYDFNLFISGYADAVDSEGWVYDHKFTGATYYVEDEPKEKDKRQVMMYIYGMDDVHAGQLEYIGRTGKFEKGDYITHTVELDISTIKKITQNMAEVAQAVKNRIHTDKMYENPFDKCDRDGGDPCYFCQNETLKNQEIKGLKNSNPPHR